MVTRLVFSDRQWVTRVVLSNKQLFQGHQTGSFGQTFASGLPDWYFQAKMHLSRLFRFSVETHSFSLTELRLRLWELQIWDSQFSDLLRWNSQTFRLTDFWLIDLQTCKAGRLKRLSGWQSWDWHFQTDKVEIYTLSDRQRRDSYAGTHRRSDQQIWDRSTFRFTELRLRDFQPYRVQIHERFSHLQTWFKIVSHSQRVILFIQSFRDLSSVVY